MGNKSKWNRFCEKTEWLETGTGKTAMIVIALVMMIWAGWSSYETKQLQDEGRPLEQYELSE